MKKALCVVLALAMVFAAGCAKKAAKVEAAYVSPNLYQDWDCDQILSEMANISRRIKELETKMDKEYKKDAWAMGIGMILFWPALFFLSGGNETEQNELSRLKGEYEALHDMSVQKKCEISQPQPAPETTQPAPEENEGEEK